MYSQLIIKFEPTNANDVPNLQESNEIQRIVELFLCLFFSNQKIHFQEPTTLIRVPVAIKLVTAKSEANYAL
jgi:hypothetical protein